MNVGRHRRRKGGLLHPAEPPRHTSRRLHVARESEPPSPLWERANWFEGLGWSDELPWPTAATVSAEQLGGVRRQHVVPQPMTDVATIRPT
jgi:hypothetical protein